MRAQLLFKRTKHEKAWTAVPKNVPIPLSAFSQFLELVVVNKAYVMTSSSTGTAAVAAVALSSERLYQLAIASSQSV